MDRTLAALCWRMRCRRRSVIPMYRRPVDSLQRTYTNRRLTAMPMLVPEVGFESAFGG